MACGWCSRAAMRPSRMARCFASCACSRVRPGASNNCLTATTRCNRSSVARHTTPIAPVPIRSASRYRPAINRSAVMWSCPFCRASPHRRADPSMTEKRTRRSALPPGPWDERHPPTAPDAVATLRQWHTPPTDIHPRRATRTGRRGPAHNAVAALPPPAVHALKYLASGCRSTNASVDCSGCSCSSSESTTPIRSASSRSTSLARSSRSGHAP
ncbi:Uncharacterised protein [Mycobacteroides abscessus subsp. abscessus]|nr:Uncharacterised protein [Mycobacteroides abscessus subsp. abscessus]